MDISTNPYEADQYNIVIVEDHLCTYRVDRSWLEDKGFSTKHLLQDKIDDDLLFNALQDDDGVQILENSVSDRVIAGAPVFEQETKDAPKPTSAHAKEAIDALNEAEYSRGQGSSESHTSYWVLQASVHQLLSTVDPEVFGELYANANAAYLEAERALNEAEDAMSQGHIIRAKSALHQAVEHATRTVQETQGAAR